jgi:hypothetical protein
MEHKLFFVFAGDYHVEFEGALAYDSLHYSLIDAKNRAVHLIEYTDWVHIAELIDNRLDIVLEGFWTEDGDLEWDPE